MIEINLIPDVKSELLRARTLRNVVFFISGIVSIASIAIVILISGTVFVVQPFIISSKNKDIETSFTELEEHPNIQSTVTLLNQLNQIQSVRASSPVNSRILGQIIVAIQPVGDYNLSYSSINYDPISQMISIEGESDGGFPALEAFLKTIRETKIGYRLDPKDEPCSADDIINETNDCISELLTNQEVVTDEQSLTDSTEGGGKTLRFRVSFIVNETALSFSSRNFAVLPPGRKDVTDSKTQIPDDMFKARVDNESEGQ